MQLGSDFIRALMQLTEERNLSQSIILGSIEAALASAYKKYKEKNLEPEVKIDGETGNISIMEIRRVVDEVKNSDAELTSEDAAALGFPGLVEGDVVKTEVEIAPESFGRIAAQTARQVIIQRLKDAEREIIFNEFSERVGDMVNGVVFKAENDQILVRISERTEAMLPREERINGETYELGSRMKFYLLDVRQTTRGPRIVVSRTHPGLLRRLMELEIPEIRDGVVEIHGIVREAGARAKVAVTTLDPNVDPVGACVGNGGSRIKTISNELNGEKIDVVIWSDDPLQYIRNTLSPAKVVRVEPVLEQEKSAKVFARPDQLSLAIGKAGQNVRLAARLTGWKVDINPLEAPEKDSMPTLQDLFEDIP
ncbi:MULTISPECIES: transcription termination factor NusA [Dethiosulfovibrio]|jgi:N utilization substance protein A|uniref:Transcription termination/antitermination protein NusA n=2 Tax=Dethiosulfovibrio TaxID=47054 RepID=A0ABS9EQ90_9BACT|nr:MULTISPECIES: transcription termination factor NusA [Dethiosulfovibrio]MCF4113600.1 transcription termination factor NusA [Dethiosulfovibrio russensis]MCF4142070.1 transcription termination factor NusA [Dethiosulfovibrio marinus]MCF4144225.1 transcription termination factor NusA [Dethiosulfovibrio acidaminovorans]